MKCTQIPIGIIFMMLFPQFSQAQIPVKRPEVPKGYQAKYISPQALSQWRLLGKGSIIDEGHNQAMLSESKSSKGAMIISPETYDDQVIITYRVMALTPGTVLVAILSASDTGKSTTLTIPADYDGRMPFWMYTAENYFFAFHNAPHNHTPFLRKYPQPPPGNQAMASIDYPVTQVGRWHTVEAGRDAATLWLTIDGRRLFTIKDPNPLSGGHIALRTRGTGRELASCLITDVHILTPKR